MVTGRASGGPGEIRWGADTGAGHGGGPPPSNSAYFKR